MNDLSLRFFCFCVIGKATPGASIKVVQVIQNIEHAEGELFAALTLLEFCHLVYFKVTMCIVSVSSLSGLLLP